MIGIWTLLKFGGPIIVVLLVGTYLKAYWDGKARANAAWQAIIYAERVAQERKIRQADEEAFRAIDRINTEKEARDALIAQLSDEAAKDPGANNIALPVDSVRRINRSRPGRSQ